MKPRNLGAVLAITGALATSTALAAGTAGLPAEQHQGDIAYVTGGVGKGEAKVFRRAIGTYPLALEFVKQAGKRDEFLAGIKVEVVDQRGKTVLSTESEGPFLLAKMPTGRYTVSATYDGKTLKRTIAVEGMAERPIVFEWKRNA